MTTNTAAKGLQAVKFEKLSQYVQQIKESLTGSVKSTYAIRRIQAKDAWAARDLIHKALLAKGGIGMDMFYYDKELGDLYGQYNWSDSFFAVLTFKKEIIGTIGIRPLTEAPGQQSATACELKKLHVSSRHMSEGHKERLLDFAIKKAIEMGYTRYQILIDDKDFELDRALSQRGFEAQREISYPGMKLMRYTQSDSSLSKAS